MILVMLIFAFFIDAPPFRSGPVAPAYDASQAPILPKAWRVAPLRCIVWGSRTCPPCKILAETIESLNAAGWPIDYYLAEAQPVQAAEWHPAAYPTLIVIREKGNEVEEIARTSGALSGQDLVAWLKRHGVRLPKPAP